MSSNIRLTLVSIALAAALAAVLLSRSMLAVPPSSSATQLVLSPGLMLLGIGCLLGLGGALHGLRKIHLKIAPKPLTDEEHVRNKWLYYTCAIKLSAQVAAADKIRHPAEFTAAETAFGISMTDRRNLGALYQHQFKTPEPLREIIRPFIRRHGKGNAACETLLFGLCEVAMSDKAMHPEELDLISQLSKMLGLNAQTTTRLLFAAGFDGNLSSKPPEGVQRAFGRKSGAGQASARPLTERDQYLAMLGLGPSADMETVRKTWRKLASKYHPDKLVAQNLPAEELEKAKALMLSINASYEWLKEHS